MHMLRLHLDRINFFFELLTNFYLGQTHWLIVKIILCILLFIDLYMHMLRVHLDHINFFFESLTNFYLGQNHWPIVKIILYVLLFIDVKYFCVHAYWECTLTILTFFLIIDQFLTWSKSLTNSQNHLLHIILHYRCPLFIHAYVESTPWPTFF
jgi:hypothetical protein